VPVPAATEPDLAPSEPRSTLTEPDLASSEPRSTSTEPDRMLNEPTSVVATIVQCRFDLDEDPA